LIAQIKLNSEPKTKTPEMFPGLFKNKKPRVATKSTRGVNDQILALTYRMDASKVKKEAPEIKISFCRINCVHLCSSIDK
jgi:hypothetical protein